MGIRHGGDFSSIKERRQLKIEDSLRLREAGVQNVTYPLEVWDEKLWPVIVPGKEKYVGRKEWMERLVQAVEIFGRKHVHTLFVVGVELAPPPEEGGKSYEKGIQSVLEGIEWALKNDIRPRIIPRLRNAGSRYELADLAPTEYLLTVALEYHRLMKKYGMYHSVEDSIGTGYCYRCNWFCVDMDFPRLLDNCQCSDCT